MQATSNQQPPVLEGHVLRIRFHDPNSGFVIAVVEVKSDRASEEVVVKGKLPHVKAGIDIRAWGEWEDHPQWGRQLRAERAEIVEPVTTKGIVSFLSSSLITGIGPVLAQRIVDRFGEKTLEILKTEPERLLEIPGISHAKLEQIVSSYEEARVYEEALAILSQYDISENKAMKAVNHFGRDAVRVIREEPYRLCEIEGIGFITADKIAASVGIDATDPARINAAIDYTLEQALHNEGHLYLPFNELIKRTYANLNETDRPVSWNIVEEACIHRIDEGSLIDDPNFPDHPVYQPRYYKMEHSVARHLARIAKSKAPVIADPETRIRDIEQRLGLTLEVQQKEALLQLVNNSALVVTGGPGTGKTTIVRAAIELLKFITDPQRIVLAAPTGKAAKRLSEVTGMGASTIHRLLEFNPVFGRFMRNADDPLDADVVIIDEVSMLDLPLAHMLFQAIPDGCRLVLVGDVDQLPSVGPGSVLRDIIGSGIIPVVYLTAIFRQAHDSSIIVNAHRVNNGEMPVVSRDKKDFFLIEEPNNDLIANHVKDIVLRLRNRYDPMDIQVLSPLWRTTTGVHHLNKVLQDALNPALPGTEEFIYGGQVFRVGDRVIQFRNDYDKGVFNGEIGIVQDIRPAGDTPSREDSLVVSFDGKLVTYKRAEVDELGLAYAMTIHRSQGSEWPAVVMVLTTQHYVMLARNLLYTGITRARNILVLIGSRQAIGMAVRNDKIATRYSHLRERLMMERGIVPLVF